jgi:hypothetical protein
MAQDAALAEPDRVALVSDDLRLTRRRRRSDASTAPIRFGAGCRARHPLVAVAVEIVETIGYTLTRLHDGLDRLLTWLRDLGRI